MKINPTYIRVAFYFAAPLLGSIPGVDVDTTAGLITIDIDTFVAGIVVAAGASWGVFAKWGKR